ncbi:hypothetical protein M405DRAFT_935522 [Rhizopogon salebrosus TDB-379]|nr:hypothetical protein M405DRAFT_935522 [Rhizopogon salebrosus TDB-379]
MPIMESRRQSRKCSSSGCSPHRLLGAQGLYRYTRLAISRNSAMVFTIRDLKRLSTLQLSLVLAITYEALVSTACSFVPTVVASLLCSTLGLTVPSSATNSHHATSSSTTSSRYRRITLLSYQITCLEAGELLTSPRLLDSFCTALCNGCMASTVHTHLSCYFSFSDSHVVLFVTSTLNV